MRVVPLVAAMVATGCGLVGLTPKAPATLDARAQATPFTLPAHDGRTIELAATLAKQDVVLVFYRGHW